MSLWSKAVRALTPAVPILAAGPTPATRQNSMELARVLTEFREQRAEDFAQLADRAGRSGAQLAEAEKERDRWRAYAEELERLCLQHGIEMPPAPDEDV